MDIKLKDETLVSAKPYTMSPRQKETLRLEIRKLLDLGVIEVGLSNFTYSMILAKVMRKVPALIIGS